MYPLIIKPFPLLKNSDLNQPMYPLIRVARTADTQNHMLEAQLVKSRPQIFLCGLYCAFKVLNELHSLISRLQTSSSAFSDYLAWRKTSRGSSSPRYQTWVSCIAFRFLTIWATREAPSHRKTYQLETTQPHSYTWGHPNGQGQMLFQLARAPSLCQGPHQRDCLTFLGIMLATPPSDSRLPLTPEINFHNLIWLVLRPNP